MLISKSKVLRFFSYFLLIFIFFMASRTIGPLFLGTGEAGGENKLWKIFWALVYLGTAFLLFLRHRDFLAIIKKNPLLVLLILLPLFSTFWSGVPLLTLQRAIALLGTTFLSFLIVIIYTEKEIVGIFSFYFIISALLSLAVGLLMPDIGVMAGNHSGLWSGIYPHKNYMGRFMAMGTITLLIMTIVSGKRQYLLGALSCFFLVVMSGSAGALAVLFSLLAFTFFIYIMQQPLQKFTKATIIVFLIGMFFHGVLGVIFSAESLLALIDKDTKTFVGRTDLWRIAWHMSQNKFFLGYGYNAFWLGEKGPSAEFWRYASWDAPHAHNGLVDLLLVLGAVGVVLFISVFLLALLQGYLFYLKSNSFYSVWALTILLWVFIANLAEVVILTQNDFQWIIFVVGVLMISQFSKGERQHE